MRSFQFVSVSPSDNTPKADQRRLVRSNAASYQWSQQKKKRRRQQNSPVSDEEGTTHVGLTDDDDAAEPTLLGASSPSEFSDVTEKHSNAQGVRDAKRSRSLISQSRLYLPSPQSIHQVVSPTDQAGQLMRFNVEYIIPRLVPEIQKGIPNPATDIWVRLAMEHTTLYKVWVHCVSVYYWALRGSFRQTALLLSTHSQALELLNAEMKRPSSACSDENILSVWGLAVHGWEPFPIPGRRGPTTGRMKHLQSLDRYSLMKFVPLHLDGLDALIQMRGGLTEIKLQGVAALISYTGLVEATKILTRPRWQFVPVCSVFTRLEDMDTLVHPSHPLANIGTGFSATFSSSSAGLAQDFYTVLLDISSFTTILFSVHNGYQFPESVGKVADQRNHIHHALLSLPEDPYPTPSSVYERYYESTRLATIIFSLLVIFPITSSAASFQMLASRLMAQLQRMETHIPSPEEMDLHSWILFMGGIAAISCPERSWYVSRLAAISQEFDLSSWEDVKMILERFLWLRSTNEIDGMSLWDEFQQVAVSPPPEQHELRNLIVHNT